MRYFRNRAPVTVDVDHMKTLHEECCEQLDLIKVALAAAQLSSDMMRDRLDAMAAAHWCVYMDIIHLICMHDEIMNTQIKAVGLDLRAEDADDEPQYQTKRALLLNLSTALSRHHQRVIYIYSLHEDIMKDYLHQSATAERESIAALIEMLHTTL